MTPLRLWILRLGLRWSERSIDAPWTPRASWRIDRILVALENPEG